MENNLNFVSPRIRLSNSYQEYVSNKFTYETDLNQIFNISLRGFIIGERGAGKTTVLKNIENSAINHLNKEIIYISLLFAGMRGEKIDDIIRRRVKNTKTYFENVILLIDDIDKITNTSIILELLSFLKSYRNLSAYIAVSPSFLSENKFLYDLGEMKYILIGNLENKFYQNPNSDLKFGAENKISDKNIDKTNYWLLCYNPRSWPLVFKYNETYWFHENYTETPNSNVLINLTAAKIGDYIVGCPNFDEAKCNVIFQVTSELHYSEKHSGKIIEFRPVFITNLGFSAGNLMDDEIVYEYFSDFRYQIGFYEISEEAYISILELFRIDNEDFIGINNSNDEHVMATIDNDIDHDDVLDKLNFEPDINALASLIAYRNIKPPLAIGLFGNWGTGKSYFMHHLAKKVTAYSNIKKETFSENIINIHFNSWHYIDTNLWASLVNHIFNSINKYFNQITGNNHTEITKLYNSFNSVTQYKNKKEQEKNLVLNQITTLSQELESLRLEKKTKIDKLEISTDDILKAVFNNDEVKTKIDELKKISLGPELKTIDTIDSQLSYLQNFGVRINLAFRNICKYGKQEILFFIILPIFIFLAPILFGICIKNDWPNWYQFLNSYFTKITTFLSSVIVFLIPINKVLGKYESLHSSIQKLKQDKLEEKWGKEKEIEGVISEYKIKEDLINNEITTLIIQKSDIENQIKEIESGKRLYNWIAEKAENGEYRKHLGLISTIREDFEMLDALMLDQEKARRMRNLDKIEDIHVKIDRIVLFIDDLDRCPEEYVVEVLQAVHLLMAFKLFVVVVGVDARWIKNAVENSYKSEMGTAKSKPTLTANEYLEKIFQVTFKLRNLSDKNSKDYIKYLTTPKIVKSNDFKSPTTTNASVVDEIAKNTTNQTIPSLGGTTTTNVFENNEPNNTIESEIIELELLDIEIEYMEQISKIISNSPRTLKRFVNMYRILRVHKDFTNQNPTDNHKKVAILLLALQIGGHFNDCNWFKQLTLENKKSFRETKPLPYILDSLNLDLLDLKVVDYLKVIELVDRFGFNEN